MATATTDRRTAASVEEWEIDALDLILDNEEDLYLRGMAATVRHCAFIVKGTYSPELAARDWARIYHDANRRAIEWGGRGEGSRVAVRKAAAAARVTDEYARILDLEYVQDDDLRADVRHPKHAAQATIYQANRDAARRAA